LDLEDLKKPGADKRRRGYGKIGARKTNTGQNTNSRQRKRRASLQQIRKQTRTVKGRRVHDLSHGEPIRFGEARGRETSLRKADKESP